MPTIVDIESNQLEQFKCSIQCDVDVEFLLDVIGDKQVFHLNFWYQATYCLPHSEVHVIGYYGEAPWWSALYTYH